VNVAMNKKVIEKGEGYEVYEDYSFKAKCVKCGNEEERAGDEPVAELYHKWNGKIKEHVCKECFGKSSEDKRRDDIAYAQSWNLAVQVSVNSVKKDVDSEDFN